MAHVERILDVRGDAAAFRNGVMGRIGGWTVDHAGQDMDYEEVFPEYLDRLKEDFYRGRKTIVEQISRHLLKVGTDEVALLDADVKAQVERALERMCSRHGY